MMRVVRKKKEDWRIDAEELATGIGLLIEVAALVALYAGVPLLVLISLLWIIHA